MREEKHNNEISGPVRTDAGFSIIEMLIAICVIVFGLVSIAGISAYVSRANSTSATLNVLAAAAQDQVDRLRTARWTRTFIDPMLTVGGSVPYVAHMAEPSAADRLPIGWARSRNAGFLSFPVAAAAPEPLSIEGGGYTYTLDPNDPHHATATGTPVGDLNINWQVREGATPNLRYVTIRVVQTMPAPQLADGITVTTIIVKN